MVDEADWPRRAKTNGLGLRVISGGGPRNRIELLVEKLNAAPSFQHVTMRELIIELATYLYDLRAYTDELERRVKTLEGERGPHIHP